jgi:dTDP-4-amino-4,6-dideoxygalactose transaminase
VVAVSLFGRPLDATAFESFADGHGLALVEDAAQALGASAAGRPAGSVGVAGSLSFDPTKPVAAPGSGGAVVTDDEALAQTCRRLRCHGRDGAGPSSVLGYNSRLSTTAAAALRVKLRLEPAWRARRASVAAAYSAAVESIEELTPPGGIAGIEHAYSKYVLRVDGGTRPRGELVAALHRAGVPTQVHYPLALHAHPVFADYPPAGAVPLTAAALTERVLSLPIHPFLRDDEVERVACALNAWSSRSRT